MNEQIKLNENFQSAKLTEHSKSKKSEEKFETEAKTIVKTEKKEISIDQSPLDEVNVVSFDLDEKQQNESVVSSSLPGDTCTEPNLKLKICDRHSEKNTFSLNRNFKLLLDDLILSCSLFVTYRTPFLIIENNSDPLIKYLPINYMNFLRSNILLKDSAVSTANHKNVFGPSYDSIFNDSCNENNENHIHDFLLMHLTKSFDNEDFKKLYADYKSRGGIASTLHSPKRLQLENFTDGIDLNETGNSNDHKTKTKSNNHSDHSIENVNVYDCLDVFNRQHLAVLFYSQCETSPVFPNICNKPRVINMKYYSENDMTLGKAEIYYYHIFKSK